MNARRLFVALALLSVLAACGGANSTTSKSATSSPPAVTTTSTSAPSPTPTAQAVTAAQSISVAKAIFPYGSQDGVGYLECDHGVTDVSGCPFSTRLKTEIAHYASNYKTLCPSGCGGALLIIRDQCGAFPNEQVTTAPNPAVAIVTLSGDTTCRGVNKTFYVSVIIENGTPVADNIDCNVGQDQYGMYNSDANATGPPPCSSS